ncbi:MAG: hypothetical protein ABWZ98_09870, partial [Nakamurella sp.]
ANVLVTQKFDWVGPKAPPIIDRALWALLSPADATGQLDRLLAHRLTHPDHVMSAATAFATPWPGELARRFTTWLPTGGNAGVPAPRQLWDLLASATALPDCREMADLLREVVAVATRDNSVNPSGALTTRASNAIKLLTLRAVLYETLSVPGGR